MTFLAPRRFSPLLRSAAAGMYAGMLALALLAGPFALAAEQQWQPLFNGEDLEDWKVKFTGYPLGHNYRNTFRVQDGYLTVSYDNWPDFNNEFGHLFFDQRFSHYLLSIEYRFVGEQVNDGPAWAFRNNGMMLHSQQPETVSVQQEFPVSIEAQLLGGNGSEPRPNGNVCTPGTHMKMAGELITRHCTNSQSATYHGDQWVSMEIEVRGAELIIHRIEGEEVMRYTDIQLDPEDPDAQALLDSGASFKLDQGYIAIQAESHPIQFRRIDVKPLD